MGTAETDGMRAQREEAERELARMRSLAQEAAISGSEIEDYGTVKNRLVISLFLFFAARRML